jgi:hypothetical protein
MAALVTMMTRLNGVFVCASRCQLVGAQDRLICNSTNGVVASWCASVANDVYVIDSARAIIESRGVPESDYDLGHTLHTLTTARAVQLTFASCPIKSRFGSSAPNNDPFWID